MAKCTKIDTVKLALAAMMVAAPSASHAQDVFGPINVDGGKETCHETTGTELKKYRRIAAPPDRYFDEPTISVRMISGEAQKGRPSCSIQDMEKKTIAVRLQTGRTANISVPVAYTVFAHSDCGTSVANFGKTISIECETQAIMVKHSND